jgi:hypothetical protein
MLCHYTSKLLLGSGLTCMLISCNLNYILLLRHHTSKLLLGSGVTRMLISSNLNASIVYLCYVIIHPSYY